MRITFVEMGMYLQDRTHFWEMGIGWEKILGGDDLLVVVFFLLSLG